MPYWSSSKVGAVPQSQGQQKKKQTGSYRRGITLSDLKKQTAIRLAKEQHQNQNDELSFVQDRSKGVFRNRETRRHHAVSPVPYPLGTHSSSTFPEEVKMGTPNTYYGTNNHHSSVNPVSLACDLNSAPSQIMSDVPKAMDQPCYTPEKKRILAPSPIHSSSSTLDTSVKAKLPHGLTVHELKAMTKARLQAEAIEKRLDMGSDACEMFVPLSTQRSPEMRERQVRSPMVSSHNFIKGNQPSMADGNFHHESWSQDSRNDHWETGSVGTQTSDYFGSEKGYGPIEDIVYGNRARSFSANNAVGQEFRRDSPSPVVSHPGSFYDSYTPNRRRAETLSPRAGLSHLHENYPLVGGPNLPGLSSFTCPEDEAIAPLLMNSGFETFYCSIHHEANRARTSSTVSMPSISHTSDEFDHIPPVSRFGSVLEDVAPVTGLSDSFRDNSVLSSFPGQPLGENRIRASTWAATSGVNNLFGPGLIGNSADSTNELSEELASRSSAPESLRCFITSPELDVKLMPLSCTIALAFLVMCYMLLKLKRMFKVAHCVRLYVELCYLPLNK